MSEFYSYDDLMSDMDDRDDRDDRPTQSYYDGDLCVHGTYVGGCGIDWMCHWCESGVSLAEAKRIVAAEQLAKVRERAENAATALNVLLKCGMGGVRAAEFARKTSFISNPESRYGRRYSNAG